MAIYDIQLQAVPAQTLSVQLGGNLVRLRIQWMTRFEKFRIDVMDSDSNPITLGRVMNIGVNILDQIYPPQASKGYGQIILLGSPPTPENLGIDNQLVWLNG